jgi:hypothetical protein
VETYNGLNLLYSTMYVIEVIPLVRGVQIESLTYFSSTGYSRGTIVEIPVRGKTVAGVVIEVSPVSSAKTALKAATFSLRKLAPDQRTTTLSHHLSWRPSKPSTKFSPPNGELFSFRSCHRMFARASPSPIHHCRVTKQVKTLPHSSSPLRKGALHRL